MSETEVLGAYCRPGCQDKDHATFAECCQGISFSTALPQLRADTKRKGDDNDAYRRLRKQGYQPEHIDGAANLERSGVEPPKATP